MSDGDRLRIGLNLPTWPSRTTRYASWPEMRQLARDMEALGVDTLWVPDHLQRSVPNRPVFGFRECWTILTAAAEATSRIGIGPLVACTAFRNPALLAKMAATLDEVSGGRLIMGLGSGVPATDQSWSAFGYDSDRHVGRHAEAVEIVARMLREPPLTFQGEHYRTDGADILPPGPRARIPVWVAAKGDRTLGIAARWADAANLNAPVTGADDVTAFAARTVEACARVGRDPGSLEITGWARLAIRPEGVAETRPGCLAGSAEDVAATLRSIRAAGMRHLTLFVGEHDDPSPNPALTARSLDLLAPFLDALRPG